ncbi:MAG TPA: PBP1A family penicillin-binding protein [Kofleriaceae bacterium]|nr:PBP1A family penicillin-binding protein [Kofleriaceae bacterium]
MKMWNQPGPGSAPQPSAAPSRRGARGPLRPAGGPRRRRWVTVLKWLTIAAMVGGLLLVGTAAFVYWMYGRDPNLPNISSLSEYHPKQVIKVYDADHRLIGEILGPDKAKERRTYVPYEKVPQHVIDAFVAAEDNRFWTHDGIDYWGMFRAFLTNIRAGRSKQGASTITQQVVKTFLLTPEKTFKRKIQEIILARRLEKQLTKQEILSLYMNQIYFGNNRYGVQEAARFYFAKDVEGLSVGEAAVLAGIPQRPEELAPNRPKNQKAAKSRQIYVLNQLVEMGKLPPAEAQKWIDAGIQVAANPHPDLGSAPEWVDLAYEELVRELKEQNKEESVLDRQGGSIQTTLAPKLQAEAERALQTSLRAVDERMKIARPKRLIPQDKIEGELAALAKKLGKGPAGREVYDAVVTAVHDEDREIEVDLGNYKAAIVLRGEEDERWNPPDGKGATKLPSERFKIGHVVAVTAAPPGAAKAKHGRRVAFAPGPEGAVVVIDIASRKVRALVGGYSVKRGNFNRATQALRQPGSTFKPFVYAAAIDAKKATAAGRPPPVEGPYNDTDAVYNDVWRPQNYDKKHEGEVLLRYALARSINTVAIKVADEVKPEAVADLAKRMGIEHKLPTHISISLGAGEVTPLEMTNAVASFAAAGKTAKPKFIEEINGKATAPSEAREVLDPKTAYIVTDMMRSVVLSGTAARAQALGVPIAGKTGTSNDAKDTWFIGLTPDYAIGVWVGFDDPHPMGKETGGSAALPVFIELAKTMKLPNKPFSRPPGILDVKIDRKKGLLAPEGMPKSAVITELFLEGTAPTTYAANEDDITPENQQTDFFEGD